MAGAQGSDFRAFIATTGGLASIACQGDMQITTGKALAQSRTKNCLHPYVERSGFVAQFQVELENPAHATHDAIMAAHDNETVVSAALQSVKAGGLKYTGSARFVYETLDAPTSGQQSISVTLAFEGDPTRGTVSAT